jgi:hypothetical protein
MSAVVPRKDSHRQEAANAVKPPPVRQTPRPSTARGAIGQQVMRGLDRDLGKVRSHMLAQPRAATPPMKREELKTLLDARNATETRKNLKEAIEAYRDATNPAQTETARAGAVRRARGARKPGCEAGRAAAVQGLGRASQRAAGGNAAGPAGAARAARRG